MSNDRDEREDDGMPRLLPLFQIQNASLEDKLKHLESEMRGEYYNFFRVTYEAFIVQAVEQKWTPAECADHTKAFADAAFHTHTQALYNQEAFIHNRSMERVMLNEGKGE